MSIPFITSIFNQLYSLIFYIKKRLSNASYLSLKLQIFADKNYFQLKKTL